MGETGHSFDKWPDGRFFALFPVVAHGGLVIKRLMKKLSRGPVRSKVDFHFFVVSYTKNFFRNEKILFLAKVIESSNRKIHTITLHTQT